MIAPVSAGNTFAFVFTHQTISTRIGTEIVRMPTESIADNVDVDIKMSSFFLYKFSIAEYFVQEQGNLFYVT